MLIGISGWKKSIIDIELNGENRKSPSGVCLSVCLCVCVGGWIKSLGSGGKRAEGVSRFLKKCKTVF